MTPARPRVPRFLATSMLVALLFLPFISEAPNRLLTGKGVATWQVPGGTILFGVTVVLVLTAWLRPSTPSRLCQLILSGAVILLALWLAGSAAQALAATHPPASRTALGSAFWLVVVTASLSVADAARALPRPRLMGFLAGGITLLAAAILIHAGILDYLSLIREFAGHRAVLAAETLRHCVLVATALAFAILIGVPLGLHASRYERSGRGVLTGLGIVQTIPSVALFGFMVVPLSAIGASGIGFVPALLALIAYGLLPVTRSTLTALQALDPYVSEAARGMGFGPAQRLFKVQLPLALPVLLAGFRYVTVQTIGLATIAALIGAGGLGSFVFQGIAQYATDLVLMGALSVIALALTADLLLSALRRWLTPAGIMS